MLDVFKDVYPIQLSLCEIYKSEFAHTYTNTLYKLMFNFEVYYTKKYMHKKVKCLNRTFTVLKIKVTLYGIQVRCTDESGDIFECMPYQLELINE